MMLLKCCIHSVCQQIWKTQQWPQNWRRSVFILVSKKGNAKECWNYHTVALISQASKVMLKILQVRLDSTWTKNCQMFKLVLEKAEEAEIRLPTSLDHRKSKRIPEKHLLLLYWLHQSLWLWILTNWKILKEIGIPYLLNLPPEEPVFKSRATELDMKQ